jgi:hypothetical protein
MDNVSNSNSHKSNKSHKSAQSHRKKKKKCKKLGFMENLGAKLKRKLTMKAESEATINANKKGLISSKLLE